MSAQYVKNFHPIANFQMLKKRLLSLEIAPSKKPSVDALLYNIILLCFAVVRTYSYDTFAFRHLFYLAVNNS